MQAIIQRLESKKKELHHSPLCKLISDENLTPESRLSFTPAMLFFVMGFKDILAAMQVEGSADHMQQAVNVHCEEDSFHWKWYLQDLERISYGKDFLAIPPAAMLTELWSAPWAAVREVVYKSIHLAKTFSTPFYKLVLIESLEATFGCFNEPMFKLVHTLGREDELAYFGKEHAHSEANHAMEKTSEDHESASYNNYKPTIEEMGNAVHIIDEVFTAFTDAFDVWYKEGKSKVVTQTETAVV